MHSINSILFFSHLYLISFVKMQLGPFHISTEINLGSLITIAIIVGGMIKFGNGLAILNFKFNRVYFALFGQNEDDPASINHKVNAMWSRLQFDKITKHHQ